MIKLSHQKSLRGFMKIQLLFLPLICLVNLNASQNPFASGQELVDSGEDLFTAFDQQLAVDAQRNQIFFSNLVGQRKAPLGNQEERQKRKAEGQGTGRPLKRIAALAAQKTIMEALRGDRDEQVPPGAKPDKNLSSLVCVACNRLFINRAALISHQQSHNFQEGVFVNSYHCDKCEYVTDSSAVASKHASHHKDCPKGALQCLKCSYWALKPQSIKRHAQEGHKS